MGFNFIIIIIVITIMIIIIIVIINNFFFVGMILHFEILQIGLGQRKELKPTINPVKSKS